MQHVLIFPQGRTANDRTALLIYWQICWHGPLPCPHLFIDFCVVSQQTDTFWGVGTHRWGLWPPKFELWWDFCTTHMTGKFHHPTFNRSEFIVLTNKQTDKETNRCHWKHPPRSAMLHWWVIIMDVFIWLIYLQFTNTYIESKHCLRVAYVYN